MAFGFLLWGEGQDHGQGVPRHHTIGPMEYEKCVRLSRRLVDLQAILTIAENTIIQVLSGMKEFQSFGGGKMLYIIGGYLVSLGRVPPRLNNLLPNTHPRDTN
ncbi:hypothetical protein H6P81_006233 [Aristolochia fimbriata]|uniref:Uncharacterized protein n=1 Tax=Aristolochia fimbriata TaxID=158543 RepID=A0AAV7EXR2_ARIFI|nr:hypothetical protein H6P81_006233 [Aristolochia fimbriata]